MIDITEPSEWGCLALVSYIPDPLRLFFQELRRALPGEENPQPHITILPPRPLAISVEAASRQAHEILRNFSAFEVELSKVRCFPETNVLYLDLVEGNRTLHALHAALNLSALNHSEKFEFRPHLTLGGPVPVSELEAAQRQAETAWHSSGHSGRFLLSEVVCLWVNPGNEHREWRRVWSHCLQTRETIYPVASAAAATTQIY